MIDPVAVEESGATALPRSHPIGLNAYHLVELLPGQVPIGVGPRAKHIQGVFSPFLLGAGCHHLLGKHVQRPGRDGQGIQIAPANGPAEGHALGQFVAGQREQPSLGRAAHRVAGAPHPLQQDPDGPGRADLADQVDHTDVDTQFQ